MSIFDNRTLQVRCRVPEGCLAPPESYMMTAVKHVRFEGVIMIEESNRRKFLGRTAAVTAAFTIVPRHVLGGPNVVAPSDKVTLGCIGVGTEALREMPPLLASSDIQIVSVCDPSK